MTYLFDVSFATVLLLMVMLFFTMVGQMAHVFMLAMRRDVAPFAAIIAYELLLGLHLMFATVFVRDALNGYDLSVSLWVYSLVIPAEYVLWANLAPLLLGLFLMVTCKKPLMVFELAAVALWLPPCIGLLGSLWPWAVIWAASFFVFRVGASLVLDWRRRGEIVTQLSVAEAVNTIPEGILCADDRGRILLINDTMRALLPKLGFKGLLSDARELKRELEELFEEDDNMPCAGVKMHASDGSIWQLSLDELRISRRPCWRVIASDITEFEKLNLGLEQANAKLERTADELQGALLLVNEVAERNAYANMQAKVHDTIGQRLSLLHRYLEDRDDSSQRLAQLGVLTESIMGDLKGAAQPDPHAELASIVDAFALIKVDVAVTGALPREPDIADAFVRIVREAATNAVRHAQAHVILVAFEQSGKGYEMKVGNDGAAPAHSHREGTGIPGMRAAAQEIGGTLVVEREPAFTIHVTVPLGQKGESA
ncbi:MAG: sensor histidine kinase [Coriobacteriales bacterium]